MSELPSGTLTFLLTDIEGSTRLWDETPEFMRQAMVRHDTIIESTVASYRGHVVRPRGEGDSRFAVFEDPLDAVTAALEIHAALDREPWPMPTPLRVRMGLHTGDADLREGDYYGTTINRCARIRGLAYGRQTLISGLTADLIRARLADNVELRDLGEHRLRDLRQAEQLHEVIMPGITPDFPPLKSLTTSLTNLPGQLTNFVGREQALQSVKQMLSESRLVTATGSGGTGKTRLALQVGMDLLDKFDDGVWMVELAALTDPAAVAHTVASLFSLPDEADRHHLTALSTFLRAKTLLLILDNCEHLIDACAELAETLVQSCPHVRVLATSREALGVPGECVYNVPSLSLPDATMTAPDALYHTSEAVQLFVDRARAANTRFNFDEDDAQLVAQLCQRLDGIPLAIELAAARTKVLPVRELVRRLDDRFRLLTSGSRTALPRQQTLRGAIDWSYSLLPENERLLFGRLSVFAAGWTLDDAEAICAADDDPDIYSGDVLDLLTRLVEKSLVVFDQQRALPRYRYYETIHQYAREKLADSDDEARLRDRHLAWFLALAERGEPKLSTAQQAEWLERFEADLDNLRAALAWAHETDQEALLRLASALSLFWTRSGRSTEARRWLELALEGDTERARTAVRAQALTALAAARFTLNFYDSPEPLLNEAIEIFRELNDTQRLPFALWTLGTVLLHEGDSERILTLGEEALDVSTRSQDKAGRAFALGLKSLALINMGDTSARTLLEEALAINRARGDRWATAFDLIRLGWDAAFSGDNARALILFEEAYPIFRELRDRQFTAVTLTTLADLHRRMGDFAQADGLYREAAQMWDEIGHPLAMAAVLARRGYTALELGQLDSARTLFQRDLDLRLEHNDTEQVSEPLEGLARLALLEADQASEPTPLLEKAVRLLAAAQGLRPARDMGIDAFQRRLDYGRTEAEVRRRLDTAAFRRAWAEGEAMLLEAVIAEARH